jgi:hypothetical protein
MEDRLLVLAGQQFFFTLQSLPITISFKKERQADNTKFGYILNGESSKTVTSD